MAKCPILTQMWHWRRVYTPFWFCNWCCDEKLLSLKKDPELLPLLLWDCGCSVKLLDLPPPPLPLLESFLPLLLAYPYLRYMFDWELSPFGLVLEPNIARVCGIEYEISIIACSSLCNMVDNCSYEIGSILVQIA